MTKIKAIDNPEYICFKCLKDFTDNELNKIHIQSMGYGSGFDGWSTRIHLCNDCIETTDKEWWKLEEIPCEWDEGRHGFTEYKHEKEIFEFVKMLPLEGQELFWNRFSDGWNRDRYMQPQDWIDYELELLPHEKCKEYGMYSPQEKQAYQERFPICKHVQIRIYDDGSSGSKCIFGAFGNKDGTAKGHQTSTRCYECAYFELRDGEIMTVDVKEEERNRIEEQIKMLSKKLKELK